MRTDSRLRLVVLASLVFAAASLGPSSSAALISRDWKTPGDGLLTYDTVSGREWLDLTPQYELPTPRFENVIAETAPGGLYEGFRLASLGDVLALAQSAGIDTSTTDYATNKSAVEQFTTFLGGAPGSPRSIGSVQETFVLTHVVTGPQTYHVALEVRLPFITFAGVEVLRSRVDGFPNNVTPAYLFRSVPEPATLVIVGGAILLLLARRRRMCISAHLVTTETLCVP